MSVNEKMKKWISMVLCLCMLVQNCPVVAFAAETDNLCEHHAVHTPECGYREGSAGSDCTHVHEKSCGYAEAVAEVKCACEATDENGALIHTEGCGYVAPVAGADCTHVHDEVCGYVQEVKPSDCTFICTDCEAEEGHTHQYDGEAQYAQKDDSVHTVTRACTTCEEQPTKTVDEAHAYTEGVCVCGREAPVQEPALLTITAWSWVDDYEIIDPDYMDAVIPGVGAENPIDWETLVEFLPSYITAQVNGEEVEIPVTWECDTFPEAATGGKYTVKAILPVGYVLGEGVTALEVDVDLGTAQQYAITPIQPANGDGSESNPYQITTAGELYWFANLVNTKAKNNAHAKLMNNITVNENVIVDGALTSDTSSLNVWTAMGKTVFSSGWFGGSFDGNGKTISGLYVNETSNYRGFIGCLGEGASVKNLTITDSYFTSTQNSLGAFVGTMGLNTAAENPVIENCKLIDSIVSGTSYVGGIVGGGDYGEIISNCHVYNSTITGTGDNVGGIAGNVGSSSNETYIRLCSVNDSSVSGANKVGGILGCGYELYKTNISACCNYNTSVTATTQYAGGILGEDGKCYSCFVTAKVTAPKNQGPIAGYGNHSYSAYDSDVYGEAINYANSKAFTTEEIEAGVATYYLTDTTASIAVYVLWGQKIGEDKYPSWNPESNPDYIVYRMDDTENGGYIYYNGDAAAEYEPNEDGIYEIADRSDWYKFAKKAKEDPSIDGILTANIDFTGVASDKLANYVIGVSGKAYTGTFNGNGYSVINLPEVSHSLFNVIGNGGELKNLNLSDAVVATTDSVAIAGLVYNNLGTISNVTVSDVTVSSNAIAAGIIAYNRGVVTNCTASDITVTGKTAAGGIAGVNHSGNTIEDCHVVSGTVKAVGAEYDAVAGGICGSSYGGTIKGCTNNADVSAKAGRLETAAGIVGRPDSYDNVSVNIISCSNTGNINGNWAGGISGADSTATYVNISLCYNEGTITGYTAGGIAADGSINADDLIVNCYNAGAVNAVGSRAMAGGIVGNHSNNTVKNCHNYGKVTSEYVAAPISGIGVDVWPGADELINNHAIEGNIAAPNIRPYLDTEGAESSSDAIVVGSTREAFANGTITDKLNAGNSETVWYQYTEYPILEERHVHQWSYTLEGTDTIKAECTQAGCDLEDGFGGSVSIAAPDNLLYDGESKDAVCNYPDWKPAKADVSYNDIDRVNVTGQNIEASLTYGEATISVSYQIAPRELAASMVTLSPSSTSYNGTEKTVTVTVKYDSSTTLISGTDYEFTGNTATEIGTHTVTVTGKGNYTGTVEKTWTINKGSFRATISIEGWFYLDTPEVPTVSQNPENGEVTYTYYTSSGKNPTMTGTANGAETEGDVPTYAGTYYVGAVIAETEHYNKATITPTKFVISPRKVSNPTFEGLQTSYPYDNGNEIKPTFTLKDDLGNIIPESEYTVSYTDNTGAGTATITVTDNENGNYTVSGTATFGIVTHSHDWEYSAYGDTITATCSDEDRSCPNTDGGSVTIYAPEHSVYGDGKEARATYKWTMVDPDTGSAIFYQKKTGNDTWDTATTDAPTDAGTYKASLTVGTDKTIFVEYTIDQRSITITADDQTITYGDALSEYAWTISGGDLVSEHILVNVTLTPSTTNATTNGKIKPSNAIIKYGDKDVTENYAITYMDGGLIINKAGTSISFKDEIPSKTYDGGALANPTAEQLIVTGVDLDDATFNWTWYKVSVDEANKLTDAPTDAGTYYVVVSISETNNTTASSETSNAIIISPLEVTDPTITLAQNSIEYDGNPKTPAVTSVEYRGYQIPASEYTVSYSGNTNVGTATVTITDQEGGNFIVNGSTTFQITEAAAVVKAAPTPNELTYKGKAQNLITAGEANGGTMQYSTDNQTWSTTIPQGTDAGKYTVYYKVVGDANHSDTDVKSVTVIIEKAVPAYTVPAGLTATYGDTLADVALPEGWSWANGSLSIDAVGTADFEAIFTPADTDNYNTVEMELTVTVTCDHSHNENKIYSDNADGTHSLICSVCSTAIETAKHSGGKATCTALAVCAICDASYGEIDPDAHTYGSLIPAKAEVHTKTELKSAVAAHYICQLCEAYFTEDKVETTLEALTAAAPVHSYAGVITTDPTCTKTGIETWICFCGSSYTKDVAIDPNAHAWDEGKVTTAPTCSKVGVKTYTCQHNGAHTRTEDVAIDSNAHAWDEGKVTTAPTCSKVGVKTYTCQHNGAHTRTEDVAIDPEAHNMQQTAAKIDPNCVNPGKEAVFTCANGCGKTEGGEEIPAQGHTDGNGDLYCDCCGKLAYVGRVYGRSRYFTAIEIANTMLGVSGKSKFDNIVVACGKEFPDSLTGSYLAIQKNAPILLIAEGYEKMISEYIADHLAAGGTIYILGDEKVISKEIEAALAAVGKVERVASTSRYRTNLEILEESNATTGELLLASGAAPWDAMVASASGYPLMLIQDGKLRDDQKEYLEKANFSRITIIGSHVSIPGTMEEELIGYSTDVGRVGSTSRYTTSVAVAKYFCGDHSGNIVLACGTNFPDGLCGGPLAALLKAPVILTENAEKAVDDYVCRTTVGIILGSEGDDGSLITDAEAVEIFDLIAAEDIVRNPYAK